MGKGLPFTGTLMAYLLGNYPTSIRADETTAVPMFIWEENWWEIFLKSFKLLEALLNFLLGPSCQWRLGQFGHQFGHHRGVL